MMQLGYDTGEDTVMVLVRFVVMLFCIYGIAACVLIGGKAAIIFFGRLLQMIVQTIVGKLAVMGLVLWIIIKAFVPLFKGGK